MLPDVPTVVEAGFPGLAISNWWAIAAPKGTPEPVIRRLNHAIVEALGDPTVAETITRDWACVHRRRRETQFVASLRPEADAVGRGHPSRKDHA